MQRNASYLALEPGEVYIDVRNCRAGVARFRTAPSGSIANEYAANTDELSECAAGAVAAQGGALTLSGMYVCPPGLAARAVWPDDTDGWPAQATEATAKLPALPRATHMTLAEIESVLARAIAAGHAVTLARGGCRRPYLAEPYDVSDEQGTRVLVCGNIGARRVERMSLVSIARVADTGHTVDELQASQERAESGAPDGLL